MYPSQPDRGSTRSISPRSRIGQIDVPISARSGIDQIDVPISARSEIGDRLCTEMIVSCRSGRLYHSLGTRTDLQANNRRTVAEQSWNVTEQSPNSVEHLPKGRRTPPNIADHLPNSRQQHSAIFLDPGNPIQRPAASIGKSLLHNRPLRWGPSYSDCPRGTIFHCSSP
jgi:hypothetical protein